MIVLNSALSLHFAIKYDSYRICTSISIGFLSSNALCSNAF